MRKACEFLYVHVNISICAVHVYGTRMRSSLIFELHCNKNFISVSGRSSANGTNQGHKANEKIIYSINHVIYILSLEEGLDCLV